MNHCETLWHIMKHSFHCHSHYETFPFYPLSFWNVTISSISIMNHCHYETFFAIILKHSHYDMFLFHPLTFWNIPIISILIMKHSHYEILLNIICHYEMTLQNIPIFFIVIMKYCHSGGRWQNQNLTRGGLDVGGMDQKGTQHHCGIILTYVTMCDTIIKWCSIFKCFIMTFFIISGV
jgi:hypothetical protein